MGRVHKTIRGGGEIWLTFALSRLRALRLCGLQYATQRYILPDGTECTVSVKGGEEYIDISGGSCTVLLDSGVVDALSASETSPGYASGILHESGPAGGYNAPFVLPQPDSKRRLNPSNTSSGQVSGNIKFSGNTLRGSVPIDAQEARSFSRRSGSTGDEHMRSKKILAKACPASMFTGKTRLWVQSMYGVPTYEDDKLGASGEIITAGAPIPTPESTPVGRPALLVKVRSRAGINDASSIRVSTSCGVYLDTDTGGHWLIAPYDGACVAYPLVGNSCAESLRKYLVSGKNGAFTSTDLEHIEAYILSSSRPYAEFVQSAGSFNIDNEWSLGYGWHWNWSGDKADIVVSTEDVFTDDPTKSLMKSTHMRLTVNKSAAAVENGADALEAKYKSVKLTLTYDVVEPERKWAAPQNSVVFIEPLWVDGSTRFMSKTNPRYSKSMECDAPVYAFYIRNKLNIVRVKGVRVPAGSYREISPAYFDDNPIYHPGLTFGTEGGYGESKDYSSEYYEYTVYVGDESATVYLGRSSTGSRTEVSTKTVYEKDLPFTFFYDAPVYSAPFQIEYGGIPRSIAQIYASPTDRIITQQGLTARVDFVRRDCSTSESYQGYVGVVVPLDNAEAVFFVGNATKTNGYSGITDTSIRSQNVLGQTAIAPLPSGTPATYFDLYFTVDQFGSNGVLDPAENLGTATPSDYSTNTTLTDKELLVCHAGAVTVSFDGLLDAMFDPTRQEINALFSALTGTSTDAPTVVVPTGQLPTSIGVQSGLASPIIVGWV